LRVGRERLWFALCCNSRVRAITDLAFLNRIGPHLLELLDWVRMSNTVELDVRRCEELGFIKSTLAAEELGSSLMKMSCKIRIAESEHFFRSPNFAVLPPKDS